MKLLHQIDWLAPWPEAGGDDLTFYRRMSAAYSQRLALAKAYIEQSEHRPGCMYPCTCGRDALLKAMAPDQPPAAEPWDEAKCSCVYATSENTESVRKGFEMGGYVKVRCDYCKTRATAHQPCAVHTGGCDGRHEIHGPQSTSDKSTPRAE